MDTSLKLSNNLNGCQLGHNLSINDILGLTIKECRELLQNKLEITQDLYCLICCSMLKEKKIKCDVLNIYNNLFNYQFVVATSVVDGKKRYYILDPFFVQMTKTGIKYYKYLQLIIKSNTRGKALFEQLVSYGCFEYNEIDMKLYCDAVYYSMVEKFQNKKMKVTGKQYFDKTLLKCFPEMNKKNRIR